MLLLFYFPPPSPASLSPTYTRPEADIYEGGRQYYDERERQKPHSMASSRYDNRVDTRTRSDSPTRSMKNVGPRSLNNSFSF
eukprot:Pgem_evm1s4303